MMLALPAGLDDRDRADLALGQVPLQGQGVLW